MTAEPHNMVLLAINKFCSRLYYKFCSRLDYGAANGVVFYFLNPDFFFQFPDCIAYGRVSRS
jgi:hypothetical protein